MGTPTAGSRRSSPSLGWKRTSNRAGNGSHSCRTTAPSSGFPIEQDEPQRHFCQQFVGRQDIPFRENHLAERMVFREAREDKLLEPLGGDEPMGAASSLAADLCD